MLNKKTTAATDTAVYVRDLTRLFDGLLACYQELLGVIREKLAAMKRADLHVMREMTIKEQGLARTIHEREGLRRQLMDALGAALGLSARTARTMTISQLASRVSADQALMLRESADALRDVIHEVAHSNRIAGAACREVINHMRWVFASVRPELDAPTGYAGDGARVTTPSTMIFEAVG